MNGSVEERIERLERVVRAIVDRVDKALERRTIRKLPNRASFRNRVLDWINDNADAKDVTAEDVAKALRADHDAAAQALFRLEREGFVERTKQGHYRAFVDDDPLSLLGKEDA
jgi:restriction endonuclease Mrr